MIDSSVFFLVILLTTCITLKGNVMFTIFFIYLNDRVVSNYLHLVFLSGNLQLFKNNLLDIPELKQQEAATLKDIKLSLKFLDFYLWIR